MRFLHVAIVTLRLSLLRVGIGWMFALLAFNFNRISIFELGASGVLITALIGMHHFLSPFQVIWGRLADRYAVWGYRRTPWILLGALVGSLVFMALPGLAIELGAGTSGASGLALVLFLLFGLAMAANGTATFSLLAEITTERERGIVVAITHTFLVISAIFSAGVASQIMPEYSPAQMQTLYNLTPFIAVGGSLIGLVGLERRISRAEHAALLAQPAIPEQQANPLHTAVRLLGSNRQVRGFFLFLLLAIFGIFLQDAILEVFGGEVFAMTPAETNRFTQTWGSGVLLGMLLIGALCAFRPVSTRLLALPGGMGTTLCLGLLALTALIELAALVLPTLMLMGLSTGIFNVGALSMMMEMTVDGHTGL